MGKRYFKGLEDAKEYAHTQADLIAHAYKRMKETHNGALLMDAGKLYFLASRKLKESGLSFLPSNFNRILKAYGAKYNIQRIEEFVDSVRTISCEYERNFLGEEKSENLFARRQEDSIDEELERNFFSRVG